MRLSLSRVRLSKRVRLVIVVWVQIALMLNAGIASANPHGGRVVAGSAGIGQSGSTLTVTQGSDRAVINWQGFSISPGELTQFVQPNSQSAILNRVTGGNPSALLGTMQSNGQIFLINPNGILVGPNAQINVGGLTASTLDISNQQFMQGGDLVFSGNSTAGVVNYGTIRALEGNIYLIGSTVANHGTLRAPNGTVGLAAGQEVKLVDSARPGLVVRANSSSLSNIGVQNTGTIEAISAELAANGGNVYALAINNTGVVRATGSTEIGGRVFLTAPGGKIANHGDLIAKNADGSGGEVVIDAVADAAGVGTAGNATVSGRIDVSGVAGGSVKILGDEVNLVGATIDASGANGGGQVNIGGSYQGGLDVVDALAVSQVTTIDSTTSINADATLLGNGGRVIIWSDGHTDFAGNVTARGGAGGGDGGFVEVSGKQTLFFADTGRVNTLAPNGRTGMLLLDPGRVNIGTPTLAGFGVVTITAATVNTNWATTGVSISTAADGSGAGPDDINIWESLFPDNVGMSTSNPFLLDAGRDINMLADVFNNGDGTFSFTAGRDVNFFARLRSGDDSTTTGGGLITITAGEDVNLASLPGDIRADFAALAKRNVRVESFFDAADDDPAIIIIAGANPDPLVGGNLNVFSDLNRLAMVGARFGDVDITTMSREDGTAGRVDIQSRGGRAQIGFDRNAATSGANINIWADNRIDITANEIGDLAKIGHGQAGQDLRFNGDINIFQGTRVRVQALGENSTAQVGHGGPDTNIRPGLNDAPTGDITITVDRSQVFANGEGSTAMIGHGGPGGSGTVVGNISLTVADDLRLHTFDDSPQPVPLPPLADRRNATSQIGHGGRGFNALALSPGTLEGTIQVVATATDMTMLARGENDVVQIGHGGFGAIGSMGDIYVSALEVELLATGAGSTDQIGHGGPLSSGDHTGDITVAATGVGATTGYVRLEATGGGAGPVPVSTAQIGHGGALADGTASGDIDVDAAGNHPTFGGLYLFTDNDDNVAQIGHGGEQYAGTSLLGEIDVTTTAGIATLLAEGEDETVQIGHGGRFNDGAFASGDITVDIALGLELNTDDDRGHVQIGHGGFGFTATGGGMNDLSGSIDVFARGGDGLQLISDDDDATAMIGHGGFQHVADNLVSGDIDVFSENGIILEALNNDSTSQIGNGGYESESELSGSIDLAGNAGIRLFADDNDTTAQIGHGGYGSSGDATGVIDIDANDNIEVEADSTDSTAQIGHGGFESDREIDGNIFLTGAVLDLDADGFRSTAQLGHGGRSSSGERFGNIALGVLKIELAADGTNSAAQIGHGGFGAEDAAEGAILLGSLEGVSLSTGAITANATAQIGHGGNSFEGDLAGPIILLSADEVTLTTLGLNGTTQIGHGGFGATSETIDGFIGLGALGNVFVTAGGVNATAQIGHGGRDFFGDTIDGSIVSANLGLLTLTTGLNESTAQVGHGGFDAEVITGIEGDIYLAALGANLLALGNDTTAQIGHGGSGFIGESIVGDIGALEFGLVNLVAGPGDAGTAQFGHGGWEAESEIEGDIFLGAAALNLLTIGEEGTAQIGHGGTDFLGSAAGDIQVFTLGDITLSALADDSQTQIGHGGAFAQSLDPAGFDGDISVTSFFGGLTSTADGEFSVAQIGHGGFEAIGSTGDINVSATFVELVASGFGSTDQIGHGGPLSVGDHSGNITVEATGTTAGDGFVSLLADGDGFATAQIGHGGSEAIGSAAGEITVTANGPDGAVFAIDLATPADASFAQIGHGGVLFNDGVLTPGALSGAINLNAPAGGLRAIAGIDGAFVQVGHGGGASFADSLTGAITVNVLTDVIFMGGIEEFSYAQLGHGGALSSALNPSGGAINVSANDLFFTAGTDESSHVQLGHGGEEYEGDLDGAITVVANNINFSGGSGDENTYAQLGHGGNEADGNFTGDIMVTANDLTFLGGSVNDSYAQLGHGGDDADGNHGGNITVEAAGNLVFTGGSGDDAYSQLGHGGVEFGGNLTGNITVTGASLTLTGLDESAYARVGHGGESFSFPVTNITDADIDLTIDGPVFLFATQEDSTAQIGHGGRFTFLDDIVGDIILRAQGLQMISSGIDSTTQVGHIGRGAGGTVVGDITLEIAGATSLHAAAEDSTSQIGHGGRFSSFVEAEGDIIITSGNLALTADALESTAQVGHGGFRSLVDITTPSDIVALVAGEVIVNSFGETSTAQIGHGGFRVGDTGEGFEFANLAGDIFVISQFGSLAQAAKNNQSTAQIGHGGRRGAAFIDGDIIVAVASNLGISAEGFESNVQIGHGGVEFTGTAAGDIYALAGNNVFLSATGGPAEARIGHGGLGHMPPFVVQIAPGGPSLSGNIVVFSGKNMALTADSMNRSQIGHGEVGSVNPGVPMYPVEGDIVVAWDIDSQLSGVDQGNRLFLGSGSVIGVGGDPANQVRLFGFRRGVASAGGLPGPTNHYDTGAIVGGYTFNPALAPASLNAGGWRDNLEFVSWDHEQWGFGLPLDFSMPLLVDLTGLPYTGPFTFYYPGPDVPDRVPVFDIYWQYTAHALFSETVMYMFPNNPYFSNYGPSPDRPIGELAGGSNP